MAKDFIIRKAEIDDLDNILRLNFSLFKKEYDEYASDLNLEWTYCRGKEIFKNGIKNNNNYLAIAQYDNKIIGYLSGSLYNKEEASWKQGNGAELDNMFVEEKFRNNGIGKLLVEKFVDWCKKRQVDYVDVRASVQNDGGIQFYKQIGFKDYDIVLEMKL